MPKDYKQRTGGWSPPASSAVSADDPPAGSSPSVPPTLPQAASLQHTLCAILTDGTGWMRSVPADDGKTVYLKWKWTSGPLKGRYVMAVGPVTHLPYLHELLLEKRVAATDHGGPTALDRYYDANA